MARVRTPFNYDTNLASFNSGLACTDPSRARQEFAEECDINVLVERFGLGYKMPENVRMPEYGDFIGIDSYHEAANAIAEAGESFDLLPASVRTRFRNDPAEFVAFMGKSSNRDEAVKLGLIPESVAALPLTEQPAAPVAPVPVANVRVGAAPVAAPVATPVAASNSPVSS